MDVLCYAWLNSMTTDGDKRMLSSRIDDTMKALTSSFAGTDAVTLLEFLASFLRRADPTVSLASQSLKYKQVPLFWEGDRERIIHLTSRVLAAIRLSGMACHGNLIHPQARNQSAHTSGAICLHECRRLTSANLSKFGSQTTLL